MKPCCRLALVLCLVLLNACATPEARRATPTPAENAVLPDGLGWWYARFRIEDENDKLPLWHIDALIAGEIITPVFERHFAEIRVWRVHRRAANDDFGHVFSFIFYATPQSARSIFADIRANPILEQLQDGGLVTKTMFTNPAKINWPNIEDTSDKHWPLLIQRTWPAMIMGASRMWIDLVVALATVHVEEADLVQRYALVEHDIDRLWAENGQHAFLHHVDALFAYQPLLIRY